MMIFAGVKAEDILRVIPKSFQQTEPKTVYEGLRLEKDGLTVILYTSGKLQVQGKKEEVKSLEKKLVSAGLMKAGSRHFKKESGWMIGSDEALKGDTFGGLVVAAVKADDKIRGKLKEIGVADSKTLSDKEVLYLAEKIKKIAPCEIKSLLPEEYNAHGKVTVMLNQLHQEAAEFLKPGTHVVDKYPGCTVGKIREEKSESKYLEVAAASILARASALEQLNYLSSLAGFAIPKGSTHVQLALLELKHRKLDFWKFVKIDFNNVKEFMAKEKKEES